jgi:hypothetical protein
MAAAVMRAADLLIWHPRVERSADPRQGDLFHDADGGPPPAAVMPEWIARAEADGLRAELDDRRGWGLARRLHWALRRR